MNTKKMIAVILLFAVKIFGQETKEDKKNLKEVVITKEKKAVEQKADRTLFEFASQAHLNSGSVLEGLKKIPGLVSSDIAGMMYQGKQLEVFIDGRPLNITTNELNAFLEGMPANSVERIEIITNPGAEFPATSGGAILNIITNKKAKNYLTATYTNSTNITSYNKTRWRTNNSLLLNAKNKYFGWQINIGQNYAERAMWSNVLKIQNTNQSINKTLLSSTYNDKFNRNYFLKSGITFDIKKDRLLINYDLTNNQNTNYVTGTGILNTGNNFTTFDKAINTTTRHDATLTYQKRFDTNDKKLDFNFNYNKNTTNFNLDSYQYTTNLLNNTSNKNEINFKTDYSQSIKILDQGKISLGILYEKLQFNTFNNTIKNLSYQRSTAAVYTQMETKWKKFDFTLGARTENYNISGKTTSNELTPFKQTRLFPNTSLQYNILPQVNLNLNYNKKITLPSTTALNPNNTNYQNNNINFQGNPNLNPSIYDNYEIKLSGFDYFFIGYNRNIAHNQVVQYVNNTQNQATTTNINVNKLIIHDFNIGIPIPYMLFTKGISGTLNTMTQGGINPDKINFMYLYAAREFYQMENINSKPLWIFHGMSQVILPKNIKWVTNFSYITAKGNYYYFFSQKPFNTSLDMSFSKKFLNNQLAVSINIDDLFNTNQSIFQPYNTTLQLSNKNDTRRFGFTINYKIPTKNKLAKEGSNILNQDNKDDSQKQILP